jgi:hypothetical protein
MAQRRGGSKAADNRKLGFTVQPMIVERKKHNPSWDALVLEPHQMTALQQRRAGTRAERGPLEAMVILIGALEAIVAPGIALSKFELGQVDRVANQIRQLALHRQAATLVEAAVRLHAIIDGLAHLPHAPTHTIAQELPGLRRLAMRF